MKPGVNKDRVILACKRAIEATFDSSRWVELGYLTGAHDLISNHRRLLRSLSWRDPDYGECIFDVLPEILGPNLERLPEVEDFIGLERWLDEHDPVLHAELYGDRSSPVLVEEDLANLSDAASIRGHLTRIRDAASSDPELAIGTAKDLIEEPIQLGEFFNPAFSGGCESRQAAPRGTARCVPPETDREGGSPHSARTGGSPAFHASPCPQYVWRIRPGLNRRSESRPGAGAGRLARKRPPTGDADTESCKRAGQLVRKGRRRLCPKKTPPTVPACSRPWKCDTAVR
jgi:hypothetical protein